MKWTVETLDERVDREVAALPSDMRARLKRIGDLIAINGPQSVREPYSSIWKANSGKCA
jgi:hypothetical protein